MDRKKQDWALEALLESKEYDKADEAIYQLVKVAFMHGWRAAWEERELGFDEEPIEW